MRKSIDIDHLLENAVAEALGLPRPHLSAPRKLRASRAKASRRSHSAATRREGHRVAA